MADESDDRDEDDKKSRDYLQRDDAIAPRPLGPATLTIPIAPPKPDKKLGKHKDAVRFVGKLGKKQKKLKKDAVRSLDSWERYRALTDALDEAVDLVDLADHKARFALVIMAAVNVVLFVAAMMPPGFQRAERRRFSRRTRFGPTNKKLVATPSR